MKKSIDNEVQTRSGQQRQPFPVIINVFSQSAMRPWLALARATRFAARRSLCSAPPPLTVGRSVARTEDGARWVASIDVDGTAYRIGEFDTEDAATLAWDEWNALVASVDEQSSSVVAAAPLSEAWSPPAKAEEEEEEEEDAFNKLSISRCYEKRTTQHQQEEDIFCELLLD